MGWEEETKIVQISTRHLNIAIIILFVLVIAIVIFLGVMYTTFTKNTVMFALYTESSDTDESISTLDFQNDPHTIHKNGILRIKSRIINGPIKIWLSSYQSSSSEKDKISNVVTFTTKEELVLKFSSSAVVGQHFVISTNVTGERDGQLESILYQYDL